MTTWKCEVIEVRRVAVTYYVEADSEEEAREKAHDGVTDDEVARHVQEISARHVQSVERDDT
jgi:hypothetical protein